MATREYQRPQVVPVKETSAHRPTKLHTVVPRPDEAKTPRPRAAARS